MWGSFWLALIKNFNMQSQYILQTGLCTCMDITLSRYITYFLSRNIKLKSIQHTAKTIPAVDNRLNTVVTIMLILSIFT